MKGIIKKYLTEEYDIETIDTSNDAYDYQRLNGVLYRLSGKNEKIVAVSDVTHTVENTFYPDHIDRYYNYIQDGGAIETLPVHEIGLADSNRLRSLIDYLYEDLYENDYDTFWDEFRGC